MMADNRDEKAALEDFLAPYFDAARAEAARTARPALLDRVAADAAAALEGPGTAVAAPLVAGRTDGRGVLAIAAGLAAAALLGLWIGFNSPSAVGSIEMALLGAGSGTIGTIDGAGADEALFLPDIDGLLAEG